jgi:hypothetical protein
MPCPSCFTTRERPSTHWIGGCFAPGPVWISVENLAPTGIWSPDHPAHSESLYRLSYPSPSRKAIKDFNFKIINSFTIYEFQSKLSMESWQDIFEGSDTYVMFNNFLNIHLKIFYPCFTKSKINSPHRYNPLLTGGIKVMCHNNRILYTSCRGSNGTTLKLWNTISYNPHEIANTFSHYFLLLQTLLLETS